MVAIFRPWYNSSYTMAAKPIKSLELHYTMIQFLIITNIASSAEAMPVQYQNYYISMVYSSVLFLLTWQPNLRLVAKKTDVKELASPVLVHIYTSSSYLARETTTGKGICFYRLIIGEFIIKCENSSFITELN